MKSVRVLIISLCLSLLSLPGAIAQQYRPYTGYGVLIVRPLNPERPADLAPLPFFRDPGVTRITELPIGEVPRLSSIMKMPADEYPLAVMGKKGEWLLIAYDEAGREGWVKMARWWDYITWERFLKGRSFQLLPGLKKVSYVVREEPAETGRQAGTISGPERAKIAEVAGDWARVVADSGLQGWLRWRDDDGRFQISVEMNP